MRNLLTLALLLAAGAPAIAQDSVKCGKNDIVQSKDGKLIVNANAWNATSDGVSCITVNSDVSAYNVTWSWPRDRTQTHSYPYVGFHPRSLPIGLNNLTKLGLKATWDYSDQPTAGMIANVALDIWADADATKAQDATQALWELMVWYADYGSPQPLGFKAGPVMTQTLNNVEYNLYSGTNQRGVHTLTWLASEVVKTIDMDVLQLITAMKPLITEPNLVVGLIQLGTEAFFASENVTFSMNSYSLDIQPDATSTLKPTTSGKPSKGSSNVIPAWKSLTVIMLLPLVAIGMFA